MRRKLSFLSYGSMWLWMGRHSYHAGVQLTIECLTKLLRIFVASIESAELRTLAVSEVWYLSPVRIIHIPKMLTLQKCRIIELQNNDTIFTTDITDSNSITETAVKAKCICPWLWTQSPWYELEESFWIFASLVWFVVSKLLICIWVHFRNIAEYGLNE